MEILSLAVVSFPKGNSELLGVQEMTSVRAANLSRSFLQFVSVPYGIIAACDIISSVRDAGLSEVFHSASFGRYRIRVPFFNLRSLNGAVRRCAAFFLFLVSVSLN